MMKLLRQVTVCSAIIASATLAFAAPENLASTHDGAGRLFDNTIPLDGRAYAHVSAVSQPGGVMTNSGGGWFNYGGFLQAVDIKRPSLDTDGDGVPDEIARDNDGDGLSDSIEISGSKFSPNAVTQVNDPDSDDDDMSDGTEAVTQTDPNDPTAALKIIAVRRLGGTNRIAYLARGDKLYTILSHDGSFQRPHNSLGTDMETPGAGVWLVRTNTFDDVVATNRFYAIEVP